MFEELGRQGVELFGKLMATRDLPSKTVPVTASGPLDPAGSLLRRDQPLNCGSALPQPSATGRRESARPIGSASGRRQARAQLVATVDVHHAAPDLTGAARVGAPARARAVAVGHARRVTVAGVDVAVVGERGIWPSAVWKVWRHWAPATPGPQARPGCPVSRTGTQLRVR